MEVEKGLSEAWQRGGKGWRRRDFRESPPLLTVCSCQMGLVPATVTDFPGHKFGLGSAWQTLGCRQKGTQTEVRATPPPKILSFFLNGPFCLVQFFFSLVQSKSCSPNTAGASSPALQGNPRLSALLLRPSSLHQYSGERRATSGRGPSTLSLASSADGAGAAGLAES